jgi:hypothetical protein
MPVFIGISTTSGKISDWSTMATGASSHDVDDKKCLAPSSASGVHSGPHPPLGRTTALAAPGRWPEQASHQPRGQLNSFPRESVPVTVNWSRASWRRSSSRSANATRVAGSIFASVTSGRSQLPTSHARARTRRQCLSSAWPAIADTSAISVSACRYGLVMAAAVVAARRSAPWQSR